jgi:hypothetical protein
MGRRGRGWVAATAPAGGAEAPAPVLTPRPPAPATAGADARAAPARPWRLLLLGCLALSALSLLWAAVPTYDPWAWIIWGREVAHLDLSTVTGPSWKPLPVIFTTPFSLAGDDGAPLLWLLIARAGGLLAIAMAYRLAARLAGPVAGVIAAVSLVFADDFLRNPALGNSEGLLVALVLWAIERHLDGRCRDAFLLGCAAALLRPEVWPFIALYGLYLMAIDRRPRTIALVLGGGAALLALWFVPEYLGSGDFFRAAARARQPNPDSAAFADHPFLEVFRRSASRLMAPVYVGAALALLLRRDRLHVGMAAAATVLMVGVAAMAQLGFSGNLRYIALPAALVCVLAGAGWVDLVRAAKRHGTTAATALAVALLAVAAPFVAYRVHQLDLDRLDVEEDAALYGSAKDAIAAGGGREKLLQCGTVYTGAFQTQTVAWYMHLHENQVEIFAFPPGTTVAPSYTALSRDPRFPVYARTKLWKVGTSCNR